MFRHITSATLLVLFALTQIVPSLIHFSIRTHQAMVQIKCPRQQETITLQFSLKKWIAVKQTKSNEIEIDGKLFDVRSVEIEGNLVSVKGFYDTKEDKLCAISKDLKRKGTDLEKNNAGNSVLYFEEPFHYSFFKALVEPMMYETVSHAFFTSFLQKDSPPPKV
ncbi:hypothetical protein EMGBS15_12800 [Filimonas sp.]|nr:hypothetical protein EMGBS15_12800 [Filimonas sp.]